ncbi:MAG: hypothetical protein ACP5FH_06860 [Terracidiphilus sp.]
MVSDFNFNLPAGIAFAMEADRFYAGLALQARPGFEREADPGLGGKLLYAGELNAQTHALMAAANIAGTATLAVSTDLDAQKPAILDGMADFVVNSLDEALRILKNQIRKRETVAVCLAAGPGIREVDIARELLERGVCPDLVGPGAAGEFPALFFPGTPRIEAVGPGDDEVLLTWSVATASALWLPKMDSIAGDCLPPEERAARRWLRRAPRYLGRKARGIRLLRCHQSAAQRLLTRFADSVECGQIGGPVEFHSLWPPDASIRAQSSLIP